MSQGHSKPPGGKPVGTRRRAGPCKEGGQMVHAQPRSLTFADFEYICTIPTSGKILLRHLLLHTHSSYSASSLHLQVQPYNSPISLLCCALSSLKISTRFSPANCLLLNHLCCTCSKDSSKSLRVTMKVSVAGSLFFGLLCSYFHFPGCPDTGGLPSRIQAL